MRHKPQENILPVLSTEDTLQAVWADFDREEEKRRLGAVEVIEEGGVLLGAENEGNHVLGAWEEEDMLWDLDREDGDW